MTPIKLEQQRYLKVAYFYNHQHMHQKILKQGDKHTALERLIIMTAILAYTKKNSSSNNKNFIFLQ